MTTEGARGVWLLAVATAIALAGCGGGGGSGGGSVADKDARAACGALARSTFAAHGGTVLPDVPTVDRVPGAEELATAAAADGRYAALARAAGAVRQDASFFRFTRAVADRAAALSACAGLGLPRSDDSGVAGDAGAGCAALARAMPVGARPDEPTIDRLTGGLSLLHVVATDPRYADLAAPAQSVQVDVGGRFDFAKAGRDIPAVLTACKGLGLPH